MTHALRAAVAALGLGAIWFPGQPALADDALIAAAKKEGQAVWYTSQILNQLARPLADGFEKKYGVVAKPVRADAQQNVLRIMAEAKAGALQADIVDGTSVAPPLKRAGMLAKWQPEIAKSFGKDALDKDGYWTATNQYVIAPAYNTQLLKPGTQPKNWDDLLDPKLVGRIAVSSGASTSGGAGMVGALLHDKGEQKGMEYLRKLAGQKVALIASSARTVTDQVMQGEYAVGLFMSTNQAVSSAAQGAPVDWIKWSSSISAPNGAGLLKDAPHPNAGKLLLEYIVSPEGQKFFAAADYNPVNPAVPARFPEMKPEVGGFKVFSLTPEDVDAKIGGWDKIFKSLFK
jgi:iron(III) transport system substrate-binding protein